MAKIDIISGFLGAGKTTLIQKLLKEALAGTKVVLIENEFGQIGIDGGFLKDAGIEIKEMNSGCICCSLVGDFGASLKEVLDTYQPERVLIEPSGVGKLSDVMKAVEDVKAEDVQLNSAVAVVDASKAKLYIKNFGEFFVNQIEHAGTIILSRTGTMKQEKIEQAVAMIREHNEKATIITTPWDDIDGKDILSTIEGAKDLEAELMAEVLHHHEHHHDHDEHCTCGCHDHQHEHEECHHDHHHEHEECHHEHHHHEHEECHHEHHHHEHEECHHDHHHHEHDEHCTCGCHDHHHDHHHADEVFGSLGYETPAKYEKADIEHILEEIENEKTYGIVLRAKGMVPSPDGSWIYFDYVPGEANVRNGKPDVTGKICVIGSGLKEDALKELFAK
ncbi:MAG: cobalamin biosynthesis protein CobW [Lachnospiraceae bacterium]|nr:cobalamin biosynthesis protein CobW [Lachnospiraceae bacterium]